MNDLLIRLSNLCEVSNNVKAVNVSNDMI